VPGLISGSATTGLELERRIYQQTINCLKNAKNLLEKILNLLTFFGDFFLHFRPLK
jgi:hypothetical protein